MESRNRVAGCPADRIYARCMRAGRMWITALDFGIEQTYYHTTMKRCPSCGETKPHAYFHLSRRRRDGLQSICKSCRKLLDHDRYQRRRGMRSRSRIWERGRTAWLLSLKAGEPCTDCGRIYAPQVMQWDHLPGNLKLGNISTDFRGRSRQEILDEIAKCELVCANCHAIRTFERAGWGKVSETMWQYDCDRHERTAA